jgi:hypothetical protein
MRRRASEIYQCWLDYARDHPDRTLVAAAEVLGFDDYHEIADAIEAIHRPFNQRLRNAILQRGVSRCYANVSYSIKQGQVKYSGLVDLDLYDVRWVVRGQGDSLGQATDQAIAQLNRWQLQRPSDEVVPGRYVYSATGAARDDPRWLVASFVGGRRSRERLSAIAQAPWAYSPAGWTRVGAVWCLPLLLPDREVTRSSDDISAATGQQLSDWHLELQTSSCPDPRPQATRPTLRAEWMIEPPDHGGQLRLDDEPVSLRLSSLLVYRTDRYRCYVQPPLSSRRLVLVGSVDIAAHNS